MSQRKKIDVLQLWRLNPTRYAVCGPVSMVKRHQIEQTARDRYPFRASLVEFQFYVRF